MRLKNRICAMLVFLAVLVSSLCSCGLFSEFTKEKQPIKNPSGGGQIDALDLVSTKTAPAPVIPVYSGKNTLTAAVYEELDGAVSPFFFDTGIDRLAADLSHVKLLTFDRSGFPVTNGKNGESITYLGNDYTYYAIADVDVTRNDDGTADYDFTLREDVFFSDGTNLSADDVIFSMYVLLDPSYTGCAELSKLPISGLDAYRADMACLGDIIYYTTAGKSVPEEVSETDRQRFNDRIAAAQQTYTTQLLRNIADNTDKSILFANAGKWADKLAEEKYLTAAVMVMYGYAVWEKSEIGEYTGTLIGADGKRFDCVGSFPSGSELFTCIAAETDSLLEIDRKHPEADLNEALRGAFGSGYEYFFEVKREIGKSAAYVSGITKTGMYSLRVRLDRYDVSDINGFSIYVAPLHAYGSRESYKYTEQKFGFSKGDVREIKNRKTQVCSGAYVYRGENGEAYRFERNKLYYLGCPYITYVDLVRVDTDEDIAAAIAKGKYDLAAAELNAELLSQIGEANKKQTSVAMSKYSNGEYVYIGLNCDSLKIGEEPSSGRSMSLRRAFCAILSHYADTTYEGDVCDASYRVSVPAQLTWSGLDGADDVYGKDLFGDDICTEGMSDKEKTDSLRSAVLGYLVQAGYTLDKNESKIESAPDDGGLEFSFVIFSDGFYSEYVGNIVKSTQKLLYDIGIELTVEYVQDVQTMCSVLTEGKAQMWSFVRTVPAVPDMMSFYSKNSPKHREGTGENFSRISDKELDTLLSELGACMDINARAEMYGKIFEKVCENGAEVPLCIDYSAFLSSAVRFEDACAPRDITACFTWTKTLHSLKFVSTAIE